MRYPGETIPGPVPPIDATEVTPKAPVRQVRRVGEGPRGMAVNYPGWPQPGAELAAWQGPDRRIMCRRIYRRQAMLDTRSGADRRREESDPHRPLTHMNRRV